MTKNDIINAIEALSSKAGVAPATITGRAVGNSRLYRRLKAGGGCTVDVADRLMTYITIASREEQTVTEECCSYLVQAQPAAPAAPTQEHSHEPSSKA